VPLDPELLKLLINNGVAVLVVVLLIWRIDTKLDQINQRLDQLIAHLNDISQVARRAVTKIQ